MAFMFGTIPRRVIEEERKADQTMAAISISTTLQSKWTFDHLNCTSVAYSPARLAI
jgi:hypothetical protein